MKKIDFLFLVTLVMTINLGCSSLTSNSTVTLVKDGRPLSGIVIDSVKPTRAAQFAAYELQHVVKLITGTELPIVTDEKQIDGIPILIGESDATRKLKIKSSDFKAEEYMVTFDKDKIILIGNDSPDYGKVDYADHKTFPKIQYNYRSTTYAVYDFLEKCCGVRFYSFGDIGIAFKKQKTLTVKSVYFRHSPTMDAFRRPYFGSKTRHLPPRDVQLLQLRWRVNTIFGEVNHNVYSIFYRYWGPGKGRGMAKLFIEKRPEYFAQGYAGTYAPNALRRCVYPGDPDLPPQVCTSHPGPVAYFAEEAYKVYQGKKVPGAPFQAPVMPGKPWYYPIEEDDSALWCKCEKCRNSFSDIEPKLRYDYIHFDWVNRIAAAAAKLNPSIGIATLAYSQTLPYPDPKILKLRPNVSVQLCLGIHTWFHPGIYKWQHKLYKEWVKNEASKRPLTIWNYMLCPAHDAQIIYKYNQFFPVLYPWHAGRYFKEFAEDGIRGWFAEINPTFHLLEAYVGSRVCFDSTVDTDKLIDEYFTLYYGNAAEPMRRFYRMVEDITWDPKNYPVNTIRKVTKSSSSLGYHTDRANWHLGTPERIAKLQKIIDQAVKQAETSEEKQRVKWFVDNIWAQTVAGRKAFEAREKVRSVPIPRVTVDYAGECDGKLEKVDFDKAAKSGGWTTIKGEKLATKPELSFASDSKYFYLRYHEDGNSALTHKKAGLWTNNVEIFLAAEPDYPYGQLVITPSGEFKALRHQVIEGVIRMNEWPIKVVIKNKLDKNGWTFIMAIPLNQLLPDRKVVPGDKIYANFMRTRLWKGGTSWSWSPIFASGYAQSLYRMGEIFIAPMTQKGLLPVNGNFKSTNGILPDGWVQNKGKSFDSHGNITSDNSYLNIKSNGKCIHVYNQKIFPVHRGDKIVFEFTAKGKGNGIVAAYLNSGRGDGAGYLQKMFKVTKEAKKYKIELTVTNPNVSRITNGFRPVLAVAPGSQVEYSQLKISIIPRGK